jgi:FKBP-type peptidyl-prolyl cis-trans isomerase
MQLQHMANQKNLTEEQKARLIEGFNSTINVDENNKPLIDGRLLASEFGNIQQSIKKQMGLNINKDKFISSVLEVLNDPKVPTSEDFKAVDTEAQNYFRQTQAFAQENSPEALTNRTLGKKYIENIMEKDPGYIQTPSGLVYKMLEPGKGNKFEANDKIKVMYKGTHVDGKTFDESKEPITFAPSQVVPGFREALLMMRPGAKMIAVLPQDLAYGARGAGKDIKPYETLVFEIETLGLDTEAADAKPAAKPAVKNADVKAAEAKPADVKASTPADTTKKATSTKKAATTKKAAKKSKRK